jgi:fused signal recognition particle receptor
MMETIIAIFSEISRFVYLEVILGFLILVYLLIRLRRRRQRRLVPPEPETTQDPEQMVEEAAFEEKKPAIEAKPEDKELAPYHPCPPGEPDVKPPSKGLFERLKTGLSKTRQSLSRRFDEILSGGESVDGDVLEAVEEILITADVGVPTTMELIQRLSAHSHCLAGPESFKAFLKQEILSFLELEQPAMPEFKPHVIMVVGVNGTGKTTSIGKLAARYTSEEKKVLLAAADTFRAAAADQLSIWADRTGSDIVRHRDNADPAAVAYDGVEAAISRNADVVIVDTAGRLQTKVNLMEQLKKIKRSIAKALPGAPHEVMLVLDATTGQNAVSQARLFDEGIGVTGIILTKLDGTAKGGIVIGICHTLKIPIRYVGVGEGIDDLLPFDPQRFIDALL